MPCVHYGQGRHETWVTVKYVFSLILESKWSYDDHEKKWKSIVLVINRAACQSKIVPSCPVGLCHQDLVKVATAKN